MYEVWIKKNRYGYELYVAYEKYITLIDQNISLAILPTPPLVIKGYQKGIDHYHFLAMIYSFIMPSLAL